MSTVTDNPNETSMQLTGRDYISWSAISTYQRCPLKYSFRYVKNIPERFVSSALVFGSAIHQALQFHLKNCWQATRLPISIRFSAFISLSGEIVIRMPFVSARPNRSVPSESWRSGCFQHFNRVNCHVPTKGSWGSKRSFANR